MRDLKADLAWLNSPSRQDGKWVDALSLDQYLEECNEIAEICEHALERAIKAEALARDLVEALEDVHPRAGVVKWIKRRRVLYKAKEVLGDGE
jgi:hypothetical protein